MPVLKVLHKNPHFFKIFVRKNMRKVKEQQMKFGEVDIATIEFDLRSRDEIPKLLMGLRHIYCKLELREEVFKILECVVSKDVDNQNGRPGMELWKILVLGTLRLNCNWDYDKLQEIANNHITLRQMLGHGFFDHTTKYALQTLKDNVSLLTPEVLDKVNQVVVKAGHNLVCKKKDAELKGKSDSFVVETNVHYPTDINLLFDAIRKVITLTAMICSKVGFSDWRQSCHNIRNVKKLFNKVRKLKRSTSKDEKKKSKKEHAIIGAHCAYMDLNRSFLERAEDTIKMLRKKGLVEEEKLKEIERYAYHARRQIDQIRRRVIEGETIPHNEKVFSIFEEHTEWISKGKAGVPFELGLRVCILKDQFGFILHHMVMHNQTDDKVAVHMVHKAKKRFSNLNGCSFDKGCYSPYNVTELNKLLDSVTLPKKGKLSLADKEIEYSLEFIRERKKHPAVESAINALENHGLDICPDHGTDGFDRYVALAVTARNIQILGTIIQKKELRRQKRCQKYRLAA